MGHLSSDRKVGSEKTRPRAQLLSLRAVMLWFALASGGIIAIDLLAHTLFPRIELSIHWILHTIYIIGIGVLVARWGRSKQRELDRAYQQLASSEQQYRHLFEHNRAVQILIDPATAHIVEVNPAAALYYGHDSTVLQGSPLSLIDKRSEDEIRAFLKMAQTDSQEVLLARHQVATGEVREVEVFADPVEVNGRVLIHAIIHDMSPSAQVIQALRESEENLRILFEAMPQAVILLDDSHRINQINSSASQLLGFEPYEVLARSVTEFLPADLSRTLTDLITLSHTSGEPVQAEYTYPHPTRGTRWHEAIFTTLAQQRVLWITRDTTEQKRAEQRQIALYRIADLSRTTSDLQSFYASLHDLTRDLIGVDNFYIALYDADSNTITFPYFVDDADPPPQGPQPADGLTGRVLKTGQPLRLTREDLEELGQGGSVKRRGSSSEAWMGVPLKWNEQTLGVLAVQTYRGHRRFDERDLELLTYVSTHIASALEYRRTNDELRASEARYRTLFEESRDALYITSRDGLWIEANSAAFELFGGNREAILAQGVERLYVDPAERQRFRQTIEESGSVRDFELRLRRFDGEEFDALITATVRRDSQGEVTGYEGSIRDVTQRKRQAEALRRRDAILGALAYSSERFLLEDLDTVLPDVLARLGQAVSASRVYIRRHQRIEGQPPISRRYVEWITPGADLPHTTALPESYQYDEAGMGRWVERFRQGYPVFGVVAEFPDSERRFLEPRAIKSTAAVPIFSEGQLWGFIALDHSDHGHDWIVSEIEALRSTANALGAAIARKRAEEAEREQRAMAEALRDSSSALTSSLHVEDVLDMILNYVSRVVPHDGAHITLREGNLTRIVRVRTDPAVVHNYTYPQTLNLDEMPLLQRMVADRQGLLVFDTHTNPDWVSLPDTEWIRSHVGAPIKIKDEVIGILSLDSGTPDFFQPHHLARLTAFANQAALALDNARLYEESQERNARLSLLNTIANVGTALENTDSLLQELVDVAAGIIGGDGCFITLWDSTTQTITPAAASGVMSEVYQSMSPVGSGEKSLTQAVVQSGEVIAVEEFRGSRYSNTKYAAEFDMQSMIGLPLQADGHPLGALLIAFKQAHHFTEAEISWASQAADVISLALAKAFAYQALEQRVDQRTRQLKSANERLLVYSRMKDEFVSNVSHELRTPITSIKLYHHLAERSPDRITEYLVNLNHETERLERIIEDLLRLSEVDRGQVKLDRRPTDVNALIRQIVTDRAPLAAQQGLSLRFDETDSVPQISIDQMLIGQAVSALLTNALNYTPDGGEVVVRSRAVEYDRQSWVILSVCDTGPGIPPEERDQIFERFFRGRAGRDSRQPGTGLGLSIAHEIVELHGGRIEASDTIDGEPMTTFNIWLPVEVNSL